jgi:hypothetical protein
VTEDPDWLEPDQDDEPALADRSGDAEAASRLLESVARDRGLSVHRLSADLVVCDDGRHQVLFRGLAGARSGRVAEVLCGNDAWLRAHLARHGLPIVPTRRVDLADAGSALRAAEELGFPVRLRLADAPSGPTAGDAGSFQERWRALQEEAASPTAQVILEPPPAGPPIDVAVVGGRALAVTGADGAAAVRDLAVRAVAAVGATYGLVRVVAGPASFSIATVVPAVDAAAIDRGPTGLEISAAILCQEFEQPRTSRTGASAPAEAIVPGLRPPAPGSDTAAVTKPPPASGIDDNWIADLDPGGSE